MRFKSYKYLAAPIAIFLAMLLLVGSQSRMSAAQVFAQDSSLGTIVSGEDQAQEQDHELNQDLESVQELVQEPGQESEQNPLPEELPISASQLIVQKQRLVEEIKDQQAQLIGQLITYQQDERQYRVALDQFKRLQTLSSIEGVIAASKKVILSRNLALHTYLNVLRLKLIEAEGVELSHKRVALEEIETHQITLKQFDERVEPIQEREQVNQLTADFLPTATQVEESSYYVLSILAIARLQAVYDKAVVFNTRLQEKEGGTTAEVDISTRHRSLQEINKLIAELPPQFQVVWQLTNEARDRRSGYQYFYRKLGEQLNPIYSKLSRLVAYFEELEGITQ